MPTRACLLNIFFKDDYLTLATSDATSPQAQTQAEAQAQALALALNNDVGSVYHITEHVMGCRQQLVFPNPLVMTSSGQVVSDHYRGGYDHAPSTSSVSSTVTAPQPSLILGMYNTCLSYPCHTPYRIP